MGRGIALEDQICLVGLNKDGDGNNVNHVTSGARWEEALKTAQANGWTPTGTILDFEFHCELEASQYETPDQQQYWAIARMVLDKRKTWHGGYHTPEHQVVTDADARGLRKALEGTDVDPDLFRFLSLGAFRITG